ncbi:MAG: PAS domain S-box protein [Nitrospiraceae bacterium]|nr:PAS domain S-box protein [Nitrospiraceae bacterium]
MNREKILAILYEMSMVIGGEIRLEPLLTKTLQRFLFHTSFPCGMIFLETSEQRFPEYRRERADVRLAMAVGDFELTREKGSLVSIPACVIRGGPELIEDPALINELPCRKDHYRALLRLPIDDCGVMVLLSPELPSSDIPFTRVFQPVLANLAKAVLLCQSNEAYTESIISDRKRAEEGIRQLASIVQSSDDAIISKDLDGTIRSWNKGAEAIYGYTAAEALGQHVSLLLPPEIPDDTMAILERIRAGGHVDHYETLRLRKDGRRIYVSLTVSPINSDDGSIIGASAIARDITGRLKSEQELQRASAYNRSLIEASLDPLVTIGPDGKITDVNEATETATGRSRTELIGTDFSDYFTVPENALAGYQQVFREGSVRDYPLEIRHKNGGVMPVLYNASLYRDEEGSVIGVFAAARDITEKKTAEQELKRASAYNRSLIEASLDPLVTIGPDGKITDVNAATETATGRGRAELIGTDFSDYFTVPENALAGYQQVFREGSVRDYPLEIRHKNGGVIPVLYNASLYRDEEGSVIGVFAAARDITARKKLEEQLRHSQKMEAIGRLAGGIAHDFNNILTAIIGYGSILLRKMDEADHLRQNVELVLESANRAAALTQGLLAFSRKQVMTLRRIDLNTTITGLERFLRRIIGEDVELAVSCASRPLMIMADSGQIEQVLMNLATNARDAMSRGGRLAIATEPADMDDAFRKAHGYGKPGLYAMITVADTGAGMTADVSERIFEPFFTTKETGKGTGLGMSIVYGIVKQHGGYINVYSEPGIGTTFRIYLPRIAAAEETTEAAKPEPLPKGGTELILVAEDDDVVRRLTQSVLEEFGYRVVAAGDGEAALAAFEEYREAIDLCILDVIMPKKRGREVCQEIVRRKPGVKILFTSGYALSALSEEGILDSEYACVMKPASPAALLKKVRDTLDGRHAAKR